MPESRVPGVAAAPAIVGPVYLKYNSASGLCYASGWVGRFCIRRRRPHSRMPGCSRLAGVMPVRFLNRPSLNHHRCGIGGVLQP